MSEEVTCTSYRSISVFQIFSWMGKGTNSMHSPQKELHMKTFISIWSCFCVLLTLSLLLQAYFKTFCYLLNSVVTTCQNKNRCIQSISSMFLPIFSIIWTQSRVGFRDSSVSINSEAFVKIHLRSDIKPKALYIMQVSQQSLPCSPNVWFWLVTEHRHFTVANLVT